MELEEQNTFQIVRRQCQTVIVEDKKKKGVKVYLGKNKPYIITSIVLFRSYWAESRKGCDNRQMQTVLGREQRCTECKLFFLGPWKSSKCHHTPERYVGEVKPIHAASVWSKEQFGWSLSLESAKTTPLLFLLVLHNFPSAHAPPGKAKGMKGMTNF